MSQYIFDLKKKAEIILEEKNSLNIKCQVKFISDVSGSMNQYYFKEMLSIYQKILAISLLFDDDGEVDSIVFDNSAYELKPFNINNIDNYIEKNILYKSNFWGGTEYSPALEILMDQMDSPKGNLINKLFKKGNKQLPIYALFLTDGECDDTDLTEKSLMSLQNYNVYLQFIFIDKYIDSYYQSKVKYWADKYSNIGSIFAKDIFKMSDEELFNKLINDEFLNWIKGK